MIRKVRWSIESLTDDPEPAWTTTVPPRTWTDYTSTPEEAAQDIAGRVLAPPGVRSRVVVWTDKTATEVAATHEITRTTEEPR